MYQYTEEIFNGEGRLCPQCFDLTYDLYWCEKCKICFSLCSAIGCYQSSRIPVNTIGIAMKILAWTQNGIVMDNINTNLLSNIEFEEKPVLCLFLCPKCNHISFETIVDDIEYDLFNNGIDVDNIKKYMIDDIFIKYQDFVKDFNIARD